MATAWKLTDNHLTCVICREVFTDPATLQCNHTFCKSCLLKYTKTQTEAIPAKFIPCPSCRQQTKVTNPYSPVEEWVSQLKPSHVIQSLMDDLVGSQDPDACSVGKKDDQTTPGTVWCTDCEDGSSDVDACCVCKEDGKTTPGIMWCTTCEDAFCDACVKFHKKMPLSRNHEVVDLRIHSNRKPKVGISMCRIHKDETIKLFCKDCKMTMCTVCCSIKHRKCDDVETIDAMMSVVKEALVNETRNQEKKIQTYTDNISWTNSRIEELTSHAQATKDQVRKVRMVATEVLVRKEKELVGRIDKLTDVRLQELQAFRKSQATDLRVEQQRFEFTDKAVMSDCVADMLDMYESVGGTSRDEDASEDKRPQTCSIIFIHDTEKLMRSVDELNLGDVNVVGGLSDRTSSPVLKETHHFGSGFLISLCDVAVFVVNGFKVIAVIHSHYNLLCTQYVEKKQLQHVKLPCSPMGIAKVGGTKAAVALSDKRQIAFFEFDPEPKLQSTVTTKRKYGCLAFLNPAKLAAGTFDCPTSVDILDMWGNVLKSITTGVVNNPNYIHVTENCNVVVSEAAVKSLVSVTMDGQAVFTFTPAGDRALVCLRGITTTSTGDILIVDRDSHKVIQLTESGQFVRDVLTQKDGMWNSSGICLENDGLLYVTSGGCVKVFGCE